MIAVGHSFANDGNIKYQTNISAIDNPSPLMNKWSYVNY